MVKVIPKFPVLVHLVIIENNKILLIKRETSLKLNKESYDFCLDGLFPC